MKVLLINWLDRKNLLSGGAELHLHEIFGRIVKWGHDVTLLCSSFNDAPKKEKVDGIKVIRIGTRYNFNFYVPSAIRYLLERNEYDILIDDINKIPFFTPLYVRKKPILVILHHFFGSSIYRETFFPFALYIRLAEKLVPYIYKGKFFSVVSDSAKEELIRGGIAEKSIFVIHNAISPELRPAFTKKSKAPLILIHGRIKKYKCPDLGLHAMKRVITQVPEAKCVIAGRGDYLSSLSKLSKKLGLCDRIEFQGIGSEKEKMELLQSAWVEINTSSKEGWGITVIEANACGTPVIASDSPGLRDSVIDGKTGLLVEHGNISQLSATIIKVLKNKELREMLSHNAIEWASKFSWDESAKKMLKLIEFTLRNVSWL